MVMCPNCGKALEDGAKFCDGCGAQINTAVYCPNCGAVNSAEYAFCQTCGANMTAYAAPQQGVDPYAASYAAPVAPAPKSGFAETLKKIPKKIWLLAGAGVVAVVAVIVVLSMLLGGGSKKPNVALYIKDGEIYYSKFSKDTTFELTENLVSVSLGANYGTMGERLGYYVQFNKDCTKIFYPDRIGADGITLYCRSTKNLKAEPTRIDSGVEYYMINESGSKVLYKKDGNLYLHDMKDKEKVASDINSVRTTKDLSTIIYQTHDDASDESNVYLWKKGKDSEKLASSVKSLSYVAEDLSVIYYTKDEGTKEEEDITLYKQVVGEEEKVKIANGIAAVVQVYESGEVYYTKKVNSEKILMDYVLDDMAANDAALTEPVQPQYPKRETNPLTYPTKPYKYQFAGDDAAYEAALAQYNTDLEAYNKKKQEIEDAYTAAKEKYNKDYAEYRDVLRPAWNEKKNRDSLRENLKEAKLESTSYTLFYYNDKESVSVTEAMTSSYPTVQAYDKAALVMSTTKTGEVEKVKLSEVSGTWDVREKVEKSLNAGTEKNLVVGSAVSAIEQENAGRFRIASDGSAVYFVDDISEEKNTGNLYKIAISDGKPGAREKVDSDVYAEKLAIVWDNSISYAKNVKDNKGDLYVDGKEIDFDVELDSVESADKKVLRYYTDYNSGKQVGTLKQYKGEKVTKIADDVFSYTVLPNGDILYLNDYSISRYKGTLYRYTGGKAVKLEEEVSSLIPVWSE